MVELYAHRQFLANYVRIFGASDHDLTIYTTPGTRMQLSEALDHSLYQSMDWQTVDSGRAANILATAELRDHDVVFINSIYGGLRSCLDFVRFDSDARLVLMLHNVNRWFQPPTLGGLRERLAFRCRRRIISHVDGLLVHYPPLRRYTMAAFQPKPRVQTFVPASGRPMSNPDSGKHIRIGIPGNVDPQRRDYSQVLEAIGALPDRLARRVELHLLGPPNGDAGQQIIDSAVALDDRLANVEWFDDWATIGGFEEAIGEMDLLVSPLVEATSSGATRERYGTTTVSGAVIDALSHGVPLIHPAHVEVDASVTGAVTVYQGQADLDRLVRECVASPQTLERLQDRAQRATERVRPDRQAHRLDCILDWSNSDAFSAGTGVDLIDIEPSVRP